MKILIYLISFYTNNLFNKGNLVEYCNYKIEIASDESELMTWKFILVTILVFKFKINDFNCKEILFSKQATFSQNKNDQFIKLLGFTKEDLTNKMNPILNGNTDEANSLEHELKTSLDLNQQAAVDSANAFDQIAEVAKEKLDEKPESPVDFSFKSGK